MKARHFPPPWTVEEQAACFVVRDHSGQFYRCGLRFVYLRRLFANIRRLAERSGLVSVLNSQTPRFSRRIFHRACACLISAKERQLNQPIVGLLHCPSLRATLAQQSRQSWIKTGGFALSPQTMPRCEQGGANGIVWGLSNRQ
jgi:hypothetical protein